MKKADIYYQLIATCPYCDDDNMIDGSDTELHCGSCNKTSEIDDTDIEIR